MHDIANKRFGFYPTSTKTITAGEIPSKPYTSYKEDLKQMHPQAMPLW